MMVTAGTSITSNMIKLPAPGLTRPGRGEKEGHGKRSQPTEAGAPAGRSTDHEHRAPQASDPARLPRTSLMDRPKRNCGVPPGRHKNARAASVSRHARASELADVASAACQWTLTACKLVAPGVGDRGLAAVGQHDRGAVGGMQCEQLEARRDLRRLRKEPGTSSERTCFT